MAKSVFVVMENNFEYNDEYYYATGGGTPVKAFAHREDAQQHADALMKEFVETSDEHLLSGYFEGATDGNATWERCQTAASAGPEERLKFALEIGLSIYEVMEVEVEQGVELEDSADFEFEQ